MQTVLIVVHLFLSLGLIGLVLIQHGKGADAGAAFGSGASGTVFGAAGSANFLSRATALLASLFFVTSLTLAWFAMQSVERPGVMGGAEVQQSLPPQPDSEVPSLGVPPVPEPAAVPAMPVPGDAGEQPLPKTVE
ncbi:MAG: preprotein translocase subunit SecG [Candidatus Sedimenticola endophacoides]|uniref:Protein-export membrane protein SecG n=2 Tax=Candidatus Sedimenticola endophacoides TaxID=2548426 RepID=A0A657PVA7_9GAMM|nr:MAG: preprotein translocase subunit SecG [Candidatus Sedimenticola endophacoides]OQX35445.1 MAG: preprotein translocase subunit SecG [Candidatus Sedimenticola endophacoides]OQX39205.1 MAG: preprotein translocase subunit SecG [Candidatus Sedimenticola endophacoides]OQX40898.1 MAG: preprotein translocase subunit SecG [Candidatus Sedimenticola endophacoides]OQX44238.1 MAG: preprotein translocase subunit SecG [Candidatus Sedimenticola endophacoides]